MAKFYQNIDLLWNELQNFTIQALGSAPVTHVVAGRIYYDTSTSPGKLYYYNGSAWIAIVAAGTGDVVGPAASVDSEIALFSSTTGKLLKRNTLTGLAKMTSGVLSAATSGTDYSLGTSANATGLVKSTITTGALTTAVAGTDYVAATTGSAVQKASSGGLTAATAGTDYSAGTNALATGILKSTTTTGTLSIATAGTDYYNPGGTDVAITDGGTGASTLPTGLLKGAGTGAITAATITVDYAPSVAANATGLVKGTTTTGTLSTAAQGTDYWAPGGTDVAITDGGTGVSTLPTGILKGAGTGAITAASNATDYYGPSGTDVAIADGGTGTSSLGTYALKGNGTSAITQATLADLGATTADFSMATHKITNLTDGTAAQDATSLSQVQGLINTGTNKTAVRAASTASVVVASALVNALSMDGVTLATGDRVLLKNQSTSAENGIYIVVASGAASRATDADISAEFKGGLSVWINEGTLNGDSRYVLTTNDPITLGTTTPITFVQDFASNSTNAGAGLTATGNVLAVGAGIGITVNTDDVQVNVTGAASGGATFAGGVDRKAYGTLTTANGVLTSFAITHGLTAQALGAINFDVQIAATGEKVYPSITHTSTTVTTIDFGAYPPALNEFLWKASA